ATARAHVDVVHAGGLEGGGPVDVVAVVGVAAVDDDVAGGHQPGELGHRLPGVGRGHHHPGGAGHVELRHEVLQRGSARDGVVLGGEGVGDVLAHVVDHTGVAVAHQ